ncbi:MAG: PAS domain S-box protein [Deltaproteobacteria bacterium]|nr:PAS domain S-box protein [Deltaproteobacteria bacterium]
MTTRADAAHVRCHLRGRPWAYVQRPMPEDDRRPRPTAAQPVGQPRERHEAGAVGATGFPQLAVDGAPFGAHAYELSTEGELRLRWSNQSADRILGIDCGALIGETLEQALPATAGTDIPAALLRVAARGEPYSRELVGYERSGALEAFEVHAERIGPGQVAVYFRDVSEPRRLIEALRASEDALRTVVDGAYDAIFIHDLDGAILDVNAKMLEMYGVSREEVMQLSNALAFSSDRNPLDEAAELWRRALAGEPQRFEWIARRPRDGSEFEIEIFLRKISYHGADAVLANIRDLTDRKSLERQFAHAQKMEAIGRLASGAAHDFRNSLFVITSCAELMLETLPADSPQRAELAEIMKATARAEVLTRQLLSFSRKQPSAPRALAVNDEITRMAQMIERLLGKTVELRLDLAADVGRARLDPSQLEQVIVNLAVNAHDAMPRGGRLTIRTARGAKPSAAPLQPWAPRGERVVIEVTDTGTGIAPDLLPRIFEPFFTTKPAGTGTGLGLSMVYGAVTQNGGAIDVESDVGVGTTFRMSFPRTDDVDS